MKRVLTFYSIIFFCFSCGNHNKVSSYSNDEINSSNSGNPETTISHALGFTINYYPDYKLIKIINPWQGAKNIQFKYILVNKGKKPPQNIDDAQVIETPIKRIICLSTTHIAFLDFIDKTNTLVGVSGSRYISNFKVIELIKKGEISDVGYDQNLNFELIISLKPDLVMSYGIGSEAANYIYKLKELGITVVINAEYLEQTPLAKTEWVKFMAAFYNAEKKANEKFTYIENEYNKIVELSKFANKKPKVLTGLPWKDKWYVPGGNSYLARLISDAGGRYLWEGNDSRESLPLDIEAVFEKSLDADIWINPGAAIKKEDILIVDKRLKNFKTYRENVIFNNNAILNEFGGNDYWESGIVQPHVILKDIMHIFHPELLKYHRLVYYRKL